MTAMMVDARRQVTTQAVRVVCQECSTTVFEVRDGQVLIRSRHHGEVHVTVVPLRTLIALAEETAT